MRITSRDVRLVRDLALSHVLSRDQMLALGYFHSITRVNTRLRELEREHIVRRLETPFFAQSLYVIGRGAEVLLGERILPLTMRRAETPRFLQHALCVTNIRICLAAKGLREWKFEQQVRSTFTYVGKRFDVRPDGLAVMSSGPVLIEADPGHVDPAKFREKLTGYEAFAKSGEAERQLSSSRFKVLVVTTGQLRARRLTRLVSTSTPFDFACIPAPQLGISFARSWS